jgi:hypothetical protein
MRSRVARLWLTAQTAPAPAAMAGQRHPCGQATAGQVVAVQGELADDSEAVAVGGQRAGAVGAVDHPGLGWRRGHLGMVGQHRDGAEPAAGADLGGTTLRASRLAINRRLPTSARRAGGPATGSADTFGPPNAGPEPTAWLAAAPTEPGRSRTVCGWRGRWPRRRRRPARAGSPASSVAAPTSPPAASLRDQRLGERAPVRSPRHDGCSESARHGVLP